MKTVLRINLLSGPRNISTAMMYSFAQRNDTRIVDEPLYAYYLKTTGLNHPGRDEVLGSQETDSNKVIDELLHKDYGKTIVFFKQMTHHLIDLDLDFLRKTKNILLIRKPKKVLSSYSKVIENPTLSDIGIKQSYRLYQFLQKNKIHYLIVDAERFLSNPESMLKMICKGLEIPFQKEMLHWKSGARKEDGVWAKYWYQNVHQSTGFKPFEKKDAELAPELMKIYNEANQYYQPLLERAILLQK